LPGIAVAPAAAAAAGEPTVASIAVQRAALQKEIAAAREELAKLPEDVSADAASWLTQETALLERIDAVHAEQQRTGQHAADLAIEADDIAERTRNVRPPETEFRPPYGLAALDLLYAERDTLAQLTETLARDVDNAEAQLAEARDILEEKDRDRRAVRGAAPVAGKPPGNLRLAELESRLAQETLGLREKALKTLKLQQSLVGPKKKLLEPRFAWLKANLVLGPEPAPATKRAAELDRAIAVARADAEATAQTVIATERRTADGKGADELESRRADRQTANLTVSVLTAQRERLAEKAAVTALRRRVLAGEMTSAELRALAEENRATLDGLTRERRRDLTDLIRSRRDLQQWQRRLTQAAAADEKPERWSVERVKRLTAWIALSQAEMSDLDRLLAERSRLQEEIGSRVTLFSWRDTTARARENVVAAWNFELFSVQDQPVRVKTILAVLLLVVLGYHASRWASAQVAHRVFKRFGMNTGRRAAWQSLWFYALFVTVLVTAFNLFHISLTQFSVVSGALAVGIGFGSQNLIGNFISGIILLIERPVNQGDVIEIDGREVTVEQLGARSTIVRTLDNTHMVVPNSRLLEQPVVNWTLSDEVVRKQIRVGVAYGSPTRKVASLLAGVLAGVETVRKEPAPIVKFADFGDSALVFDLYFWTSIAERLETEDELRHRIAEVFAQEKIVMAFPQRDVHLETTKPLRVVVTTAAAAETGPAPPKD
jgi:small-conductance mechanosensitive channel